jgi:hypothetical protein
MDISRIQKNNKHIIEIICSVLKACDLKPAEVLGNADA